MNRLPEKLMACRKHYGLAQGDLAQKLQVPVTEYMNWENGNALCSIQQLTVLAEVFGVTADMLVDNTKEVVLPELPQESVEIPFLNEANDGTATMQLDTTAIAAQNTQQSNTMEFEATRVQQIVDTTTMTAAEDEEAKRLEQEREARKAERRRIRMEERRRQEEKKKKMFLIGGISAAAVLLAALLLILFRPGGGKEINTLSSVNRLALGDTYSLFINRNGEVVENGQFRPKDSFEDVVQVSAYGSHALGLKKDGTVVSENADPAVAEWEDITMIAAGANHSVGLKSDGTVVCTGDDNACEVAEWTDIKAVYAGDAVTVGVTEEGDMLVSGHMDGAAANQSNVSSVAFGKDAVIIVKKDGTALAYGSGIDTSDWTSVEHAAIGKGIAVGLKSDHTLEISCEDEDLEKKLTSWNNIRYIAACDKTVIAMNGNEKMYGAGDNEYGQYVMTAEEDTEAEQLEMPKNIKVEVTTKNIVIKWDSVENADYYEVTMDSDPETKFEKVDNNQTSVPVSSLEDGKKYTIEVIAHSEDEDAYSASEPAVYKYTYESASEKLEAVKNIQGEVGNGYTWVLTWDEVENADYYIVTLDGGPDQTVLTNRISLDLTDTNVSNGTTHNITVKAGSESSAYTESDVSKTQLTYQVAEAKYSVTILFRDTEGNEISRKSMGEIKEGKYDVTPDIPAGYSLSDPSASMYSVPDEITEGIKIFVVFKLPTENQEEGQE